jgi:hypothetical protein
VKWGLLYWLFLAQWQRVFNSNQISCLMDTKNAVYEQQRVSVLELKTLQSWKQTHERQGKSWQGNFFWSKGCKHVLTPAEQTLEHKMADSGSSLYPWCICTCPSPRICPVQRFTVFPDWLKGLGDGLEHIIWWAIFVGNGTMQESGRNRNPLNNTSHLRWQPEEF